MIKLARFSFRRSYFFAISLILWGSNLKAQQVSKTDYQGTVVEFRFLGVDSCFMDILDAVVRSDSLGERFPPNLYCYELSFLDAGSYCQVIIVPSRWNKYLPFDCNAVIECSHMLFLFCGKPNKYFFDKGKKMLNVNYQKSPDHDSLDSKVKFTDWKNSPTAIVAEYKACNDSPINLYINNGINLKSYFIKPCY